MKLLSRLLAAAALFLAQCQPQLIAAPGAVYIDKDGTIQQPTLRVPNAGVIYVDSGGTIQINGTGFLNLASGSLFGIDGHTVGPDIRALLAAGNNAGMRTALSLVPGTNVQAFSSNLSIYSGITPSSNVQTLLGASNYAAFRTSLGLVIGTNVEAWSANLDTYAGIAPSSAIQSFLGSTSTVAAADALGATGSDIASAGTTDLSSATGRFINVTGTTTINGLGTVAAGTMRWVRFTGAGTITHNGTSLILPGSASITRAAGDVAVFESLGSGNWRCVAYQKVDGTALVGGGGGALGTQVSLPPRLVIEGDSLSNAGTKYFPPHFNGTAGGLTGSPNNYNGVHSYPGGDSTGVRPLTSWAEQLIAINGAPAELFNFAWSGRTTDDMVQYYWQEAHTCSPRLTGRPAAFAFWGFCNQLAGGDSAATIWSKIQQVLAAARADGYGPIVNFTLQPTDQTSAQYLVGGSWDTKRLAVNALIVANVDANSVHVADVVVDVNQIVGIAANNTPTTGQAYTHNSAYYGTTSDIHPNAAGNALISAYTYAQLKAWASTTTPRAISAARSYAETSFRLLSPAARRQLIASDAQTTASGGSVDTSGYVGQHIGISNGASSGDFARAFWYLWFLGQNAGYSSGSPSPVYFQNLDWGRTLVADTCIYMQAGGHTYPNTHWQVVLGRANGYTPGALANGDLAVGIRVDVTSAGFLTIKALAANGTTATVSSTLATFAVDSGIIPIEILSDGYGNLYVTIDGATFVVEGVAPSGVISGNDQLSYEVYTTTGGESNTGNLRFAIPVVSCF